MGQVNRVDCAKLAVMRAGEERAKGSVAASDAFFPFPDGLRCWSTLVFVPSCNRVDQCETKRSSAAAWPPG